MNKLFRATGLLALVCTSCFGKANGDLRAEGTGDVSNPLAERGAPDTRQRAACGDGLPTAEGEKALYRRPFLQEVRAESARIVLATTEERPVIVDVSLPDGTPVITVEAERDPSTTGRLQYQSIASLDGLSPDTLYCYSVRDLTEPAGFFTAKSAGSVRFAVIGDSGTGEEDAVDVSDQLTTVPFDLALHLGDLAYEEGKPNEITDHYFHVYEDLLGLAPMYPISGNHEYATNHAAPYLEAFVLPRNAAPPNAERWYSFDYGDVHFVALDTEKVSEEQAAWLDRDLTENERPWTVVMGHRPPYSSGEHGGHEPFRRLFVPLLEKHRVPLVLSGHEHDYERFEPRNGVTYVVSGGGGRETRDVGHGSMTAFSEAVLHFLSVEVSGDEMVVHAIDGTGREFDQARILRP
jgi:acid phosphatase type 7